MQSIKGENYIARYADDIRVLYGIYGAIVGGESTTLLYMALGKLLRQLDETKLQGIIFDYRRVESFAKDTLAAHQRESYSLCRKFNLEPIPIALVVDSRLQEQMVRMIVAVTPRQENKEIVFSSAEAHAYFEALNQDKSAGV